jgi:serine/threonine-protein kinase
MTDARDRRAGELAVREGIATEDQVAECLEIRAKLVKAGAKAKTLPEILLAKGYVTKDDVKRLSQLLEEDEAAEKPALKIPGYEIVELLGKGGMGAVYKARQLSLDRIVALKVLSKDAARDESYIRRFMTEARALARLNHENIIAGIDVGEANGVHYFAMEYVDGEPLSAVIEREGAIAEKRALKIGMQVARALAHAERNGLVHRDVKPQNIMIGRNDVAKLCDLGLAMTEDERKGAAQRGQSIGTPHYISPEQARGEHRVDIRSDIYSLGATLYHAVTGETPFEGSSPMVLMTKHLTEEPPPPRKRKPGISKAFNDLVMKMMAKDREKRFQTPIELLEEMERVLSLKGGGAAMPGPGTTPAGGMPRTKTPTPKSGSLPAVGRPAAAAATKAAPAAARRRLDPAALPSVALRRYTPRETSLVPLMVAAGVLVFGTIGALLLYKGATQSRGQVEEPAPPSEEMEAAAKQSIALVVNAYNAKKIDKYEAIQKFIEIRDRYPGTEGAKAAAKYAEDLKKVEFRPHETPDDEEEPAAPPS